MALISDSLFVTLTVVQFTWFSPSACLDAHHCCLDNNDQKCRTIDAAAGYGDYYYTWFGEYYAKTKVDSNGIPMTVEGYPKKIVGDEKANWFKPNELTIDSNNPIQAAFTTSACFALVHKNIKYCFEVSGDVVTQKSVTDPFMKSKKLMDVMVTKFNRMDRWMFMWEMTNSGVFMLKIREGNKHIRNANITSENVPQAMAGLDNGQTFNGNFFRKIDGLVYPFELTSGQNDLKEGEMFKQKGLNASLFMGCSQEVTTSPPVDSTSNTTRTHPVTRLAINPRLIGFLLIVFATGLVLFIIGILIIGLYSRRKKLKAQQQQQQAIQELSRPVKPYFHKDFESTGFY